MVSILPQLVINGLIAGSIYALAASGFSLVYYVIKFLNFAQGALIALSAYIFFFFLNLMGINYAAAALLTLISSVLIMLIMNVAVYFPLRKRKATNVVLMIASLALLIFSSSFIIALFGSSTKTLLLRNQNKTFDFGMFVATEIQITIIISALAIFLLLWLVMKKTKIGKAMRALADNKEAAQIIGISPEKIYNYTFAIASALGAISGILIGLEQNLYPGMGVLIIVKGFIF